jgi:hypothetical protein
MIFMVSVKPNQQWKPMMHIKIIDRSAYTIQQIA